MNRRLQFMLLGGLFLTSGLTISQFYAQRQSTNASVTPTDYIRWRSEFKNWGRWGADDERGTTNLITPEKVMSAVKLVKTGQVVSLAHAVPQQAAADVPEAAVFHRTTLGIDANATRDNYQVSYHGQATAHMDTFCHQFADGQMYNGFSVKENITPEAGCKKGSVMAWRDGIVTRDVLYDIPQLKGVDWIEPGTPITRADLEAWEKKAGVKVSAGDALFVRTGVWARRKALGPWLRGRAEGGRSAGLDPSVIPWLKQRDIAIMGSDHPQYVSPSPLRGAVHDFALLYLGVHLFDNCDLEALADAAAARNRWEFLLTAAPLPIVGGTGSPINPIATF